MKYLIASCILYLFPFFGTAQVDYFSIGTEWRITSSWADSPNCLWTSEIQYSIKGDTIINGKKYFKLYHNTEKSNFFFDPTCGTSGFSTGLSALIRQDSQKVYLFNYFGMNSDTMLFDFNLKVGDVFHDNLFHSPYAIDTIKNIDSVLIGNSYRKRFWTVNSAPHIEYFIEGIGHNKGLLEPFDIFISSSSQLNCFRQDSINTPIIDNSRCNFNISVSDINSVPFIIYPNPAINSFVVQQENSKEFHLNIFSLNGTLLLTKTTKGKTEIDISTLQNGLLFLEIKSNNNVFYYQLLKIEG